MFIVGFGSSLMSEGAELLVFIPTLSGVVGSIVVPVMGQFPDIFIIIYSCFGNDAQDQLAVGVGALAGSTVMLLSVAWFLSIYVGRVDIDPKTGMASYKGNPKLSPDNQNFWTGTGVNLSKSTKNVVGWLVMTSLAYLIVLFPNIVYAADSTRAIAFEDKNFALAGFCICMALLIYYLCVQFINANNEDTANQLLRDELLRKSLRKKIVSLFAVMEMEMESKDLTTSSPRYDSSSFSGSDGERGDSHKSRSRSGGSAGSAGNRGEMPGANDDTIHEIDDPELFLQAAARNGEAERLITGDNSRVYHRLSLILRPFFDVYDTDRSGKMELRDVPSLFHDIGERPHKASIGIFEKLAGKDNQISFAHFLEGTIELLSQGHKDVLMHLDNQDRIASLSHHSNDDFEHQHAELLMFDDAADVPADLQSLSTEEQQNALKWRAGILISFGLFLVVFFVAPLIDVMDEVGNRLGISDFYVSFFLSPIAGDLSTVIAAYKFALRKTPKFQTLSFAGLLGSATMNNLLTLGIFFILIYVQGLAWTYMIETSAIMLVELAVGLYAFKETHTMLDALIILSFFPVSFVFIYTLMDIAGYS